MQLTQRSIEKFKILYLKNFGEKLSDEETRRKAEYLIEVYRIVHGMPSAIEFIDNKIEEEKIWSVGQIIKSYKLNLWLKTMR